MLLQIVLARSPYLKLIGVVVMLAIGASAQVQPPPGWSVQPIPGAVRLDSPSAAGSPGPVLLLLPPKSVPAQVETWFAIESVARSRSGGVPVAATNVMHQGQMLIRVVKIQRQGQISLAAFYSYPAAGWQQMVVLIIPPAVTDSDPRLQAGVGYVQSLAAGGIDLGRALGYSSASVSSAAPADQLQKSFNQAQSLQRFQNNMTTLTIDHIHAMNGTH